MSQISTCCVQTWAKYQRVVFKHEPTINVLCLNMSQISTCCVQTNKIFQLQFELANTLWIFANKDFFFSSIHQKTIMNNIENYALPGKLCSPRKACFEESEYLSVKKHLNIAPIFCFSWDLSLFKIIIILKSSVNLKIKKWSMLWINIWDNLKIG